MSVQDLAAFVQVLQFCPSCPQETTLPHLAHKRAWPRPRKPATTYSKPSSMAGPLLGHSKRGRHNTASAHACMHWSHSPFCRYPLVVLCFPTDQLYFVEEGSPPLLTDVNTAHGSECALPHRLGDALADAVADASKSAAERPQRIRDFQVTVLSSDLHSFLLLAGVCSACVDNILFEPMKPEVCWNT